MTRWTVHVDLTGSNCGPGYLEVDLTLAPPAGWTSERIREETATYYAIPLEQVGVPRPVVPFRGGSYARQPEPVRMFPPVDFSRLRPQ